MCYTTRLAISLLVTTIFPCLSVCEHTPSKKHVDSAHVRIALLELLESRAIRSSSLATHVSDALELIASKEKIAITRSSPVAPVGRYFKIGDWAYHPESLQCTSVLKSKHEVFELWFKLKEIDGKWVAGEIEYSKGGKK